MITTTKIQVEQVLDDLRLLHHALSPEEVGELTAALEARGFTSTRLLYPPSYRTNTRCVFDDAALAARLFARLRPHLPPTHADADGVRWQLAGLNPRFRACRYEGGQTFSIHRDGAQQPSPSQRSFRTVMLYLDGHEAFAGGRTRFYASRAGVERIATVAPRAGTAAVFAHDLWHDGAPVTAGVKRVFRTDVVYERATAAPAAGHGGYVWCLQPLPDGGVASGSRDGTVAVWDADGARLRTLNGHTASVISLTWSGGSLWSGSRDGTLRRWSLGGEALGAVDLEGGVVLSLAPRAGGGVVAGLADGRLRWTCAAGAPAGEVAAHACWVWDLVALGGGRLASGGEDGWVRTWSAAGALERSLHAGAPVGALCAAPDGGLIAGARDGRLRCWSADGTPRWTRSAHEGAVTALTRLPDGRLVSAGEDDRIVVHGEEPLARSHGDFVRALAVRADGRLVSGSYDATVRVWEV